MNKMYKYLKLRTIDELSDLRMREGFNEYGSHHDCKDYMNYLDDLMQEVGDSANYAKMAHDVAVVRGATIKEIAILSELRHSICHRMGTSFDDIDRFINRLEEAKRYDRK